MSQMSASQLSHIFYTKLKMNFVFFDKLFSLKLLTSRNTVTRTAKAKKGGKILASALRAFLFFCMTSVFFCHLSFLNLLSNMKFNNLSG